jgi:cytoskeletal protein CcmA (bactofilin family)
MIGVEKSRATQGRSALGRIGNEAMDHCRHPRRTSSKRVKANVIACAVVVQGKLEGNIQASDRVDLKQSAVVTGDIATQRISIDEGAYFKGGVNIQKETPKKEVVRAAAS